MLIKQAYVALLKHLINFQYKRKHFVLILFFLLNGFICRAGSDPALAFKNTPVEYHDSIYYELFKLYRNSDIKKSKSYAIEAIKTSTVYGHHLLQAKSYNALGHLLAVCNKFDSSILCYRKSIAISRTHGLVDRMIYAYNNLGILYERIDKYDSALHCYMLSYDLSLEQKSSIDQSIAKGNMGLVYLYLENYDAALSNIQTAINIRKKSGSIIGINNQLFNLVTVYNVKQRYDSALQILLEVKSNCRSGCDNRTLAVLNYQFALLNLNKGDLNDAHVSFLKSLELSVKCNDEQTLAYIKFHLALFSIRSNAYDEAIQNLQDAERLADKINLRRLKRDIFERYTDVYALMGDKDKLALYQKKFISIKDSIFNEKLANNIQHIQLTSQRKASDNIIRIKDVEISHSRIFLILVAIICFLSFAVIFLVFKASKANALVASQLEDRIIKATFDYQEKNEELTRARLELNLIVLSSTQYIVGPMATLMGLFEVFIRNESPEQQTECIRRMKETAVDIRSVVRQLTELYEIHKKHIVLEDIDLYSLVDELSHQLRNRSDLPIISVGVHGLISSTVKTNRELLVQAIIYISRYLRSESDVQIIDVSFRQNGKYTEVIIENGAIDSLGELQQRPGLFNLYLANMATWKLKGTINLSREKLQESQKSRVWIAISIPYEYVMDIANQKEWETANSFLF